MGDTGEPLSTLLKLAESVRVAKEGTGENLAGKRFFLRDLICSSKACLEDGGGAEDGGFRGAEEGGGAESGGGAEDGGWVVDDVLPDTRLADGGPVIGFGGGV